MAATREALSPLIRNQQTRRLSLEMCQKIGNQLLLNNSSPIKNCESVKSPINTNSTGSGSGVNWISPTKSPSSSSSKVTPIRRGSLNFSLNNSNATTGTGISNNNNANSNGRRRGSDIFGVGPAGDLTTQYGIGGKRRSSVICGHIQPLPTINIQESLSPPPPTPNTPLSLIINGKSSLSCKITGFISDVLLSPTCSARNDTFVTPESAGIFTPSQSTRTSIIKSKLPNKGTTSRRKSSTCYDFDEEFIGFVSKSLKLELLPEEILGRGSFGTVIGGIYHRQPVAVKVINIKRSKRRESMKREQNALGLPYHRNIAQLIDIVQMGPEKVLIIMERLRKGNLLSILNDPDVHIDIQMSVQISTEIALALNFCHSQGILHLDVKPSNILIDESGHCKLSDFGNSRRIVDIDNCHDFNEVDGTVSYKAPELFRGYRPNEKSDVYSLGITMWQIFTRETLPYPKETDHSIIYKVIAHNLRPLRPVKQNESDCNWENNVRVKYIQLYEQSWSSELEFRPTVQNIIDRLLELQ